jgi:hypothetical protein
MLYKDKKKPEEKKEEKPASKDNSIVIDNKVRYE